MLSPQLSKSHHTAQKEALTRTYSVLQQTAFPSQDGITQETWHFPAPLPASQDPKPTLSPLEVAWYCDLAVHQCFHDPADHLVE